VNAAQADDAVRDTCVKKRLRSQKDYERKVKDIVDDCEESVLKPQPCHVSQPLPLLPAPSQLLHARRHRLGADQIQQLEHYKYELSTYLAALQLAEDEACITTLQENLFAQQELAQQDTDKIEAELRAAQQKASALSRKQEQAVQKSELKHKEYIQRAKAKHEAELQALKASAQITEMQEMHILELKQHERAINEKMYEIERKKYEENIALMEATISHTQKAKALEATHEKLKATMRSLGLDSDKLLEPPRTPVAESGTDAGRALQPRAVVFGTPAAN
jgi:2-hydroxychromene-2-carboxylate isomerase